MHCDLNVYCALFSLPEDTQSHSSNPIRFKKSKIWRGSSLGVSSELIFYADRSVLISWLIPTSFHRLVSWNFLLSTTEPAEYIVYDPKFINLSLRGFNAPSEIMSVTLDSSCKDSCKLWIQYILPQSFHFLPELCSLFCLHLLTHLKNSNLSTLFISRSLFESSEHLCLW